MYPALMHTHSFNISLELMCVSTEEADCCRGSAASAYMNLKLRTMFDSTTTPCTVSCQPLKMTNSADKEGESHQVCETNTPGCMLKSNM